MVNLLFSILVIVSFASSEPPSKTSLILTQKDVAEKILKSGFKAREISSRYAQLSFPLLQAKAITNWNLQLESGQEIDRAENMSLLGDFKFERFRTQFSLSKPLTSGTVLGVNYSRLSQKTDLATAPRPQLTMDALGFFVEQSLWENSFGIGTRAALKKAEDEYQANMMGRLNELEDLVLEGLRAYWMAYVAQENFRESLAARDRYEKLVGAVRRKTSLGYSNPGELAQVQAEMEGRIQIVKNNSSEYLNAVDRLITLLGLPQGTQIEFNVPKDLPPVPKLIEKSAQELRSLQAQELRLSAAQSELEFARTSSKPSLNLVGRLTATGVDEQADGSFAEMTSGAHPTYYVGFKLQYKFGSGLLEEGVRAKEAALLLEEVRTARLKQEEQDRLLSAERKVTTAYAIAESAFKQKTFRQQALDQLNRSYNQGRTDISILIRSMNDLYATGIEAIRNLGNYQISLNEWAALRDELIPNLHNLNAKENQ